MYIDFTGYFSGMCKCKLIQNFLIVTYSNYSNLGFKLLFTYYTSLQ